MFMNVVESGSAVLLVLLPAKRTFGLAHENGCEKDFKTDFSVSQKGFLHLIFLFFFFCVKWQPYKTHAYLTLLFAARNNNLAVSLWSLSDNQSFVSLTCRYYNTSIFLCSLLSCNCIDHNSIFSPNTIYFFIKDLKCSQYLMF